MSITELEEERARLRSIAERAEDEPETPTQEELFPRGSLEGDPRTTLSNIIRGGMAVEVTASLMAAEVPVRNGALFDPEQAGEVLVTFAFQKVEVVAKRDGNGILEYWKLRQVLRPSYVQDAGQMFTREQLFDVLTEAQVPEDAIERVSGIVDGS